jgi:hypothetical protein
MKSATCPGSCQRGAQPARDTAAGHERPDLLRHRPEDRNRAITFAETPEFGQGEVAERPMAAPNVSRTNEIAHGEPGTQS